MENQEKLLFEQSQRDKLWQFKLVQYQGDWRLSVWPFYQRDGAWLPCAARFGGGFQVPLDRVSELVEALQGAVAQGGEA